MGHGGDPPHADIVEVDVREEAEVAVPHRKSDQETLSVRREDGRVVDVRPAFGRLLRMNLMGSHIYK